ncbi:MAG: alkaline phosphatase [Calditerrivibrio sp.]|nr:alkaline phosphatase [Calditerrivibrio sp.]
MKRREFLKASGFAIAALATSKELFAKKMEPSRGQGIIFMVGDGMPLGVMKGMQTIFSKELSYNSKIYELLKDPKAVLALQNTSSLSSVVTDSAPASVAWSTGSKTLNRVLSTLPDGRNLKTILELAKENGLSCGVVTTTRLTHATPAAWYSHNQNRDNEDDIAIDLLKLQLDVALGGGDRHFSPEGRKDKKDLYAEFMAKGYDVVKNRESLKEKLYSNRPLLGVFSSSHISYYVDRVNDKNIASTQPDLPEMTIAALNRLSKNPKGFILQIEAGRIDHASHANDAWSAMMDCYEFDKTVEVVLDFIKKNPRTLLIITSDHGNSGWGINGTGPEYNDSTEGLFFYKQNKASFEYMIKLMKKQDQKSIKEIFEQYTSTKISPEEADAIFKGLNEKKEYTINDIWYEPEATMGRILAHSKYQSSGEKLSKPAISRRGNVNWTSTNHTAEDQIVIAYGHKAHELGIKSYIDNTDLYFAMSKFLGLKYKNPVMTEEEARSYLKSISMKEWMEHLKLHIS